MRPAASRWAARLLHCWIRVACGSALARRQCHPADNCFPTNVPCSALSGVLRPDGHWAVKAPDLGEEMVVDAIELE